ETKTRAPDRTPLALRELAALREAPTDDRGSTVGFDSGQFARELSGSVGMNNNIMKIHLRKIRCIFSIVLAKSLLFTASTSQAQCSGQWLPGEGLPGTNALVSALAVFPNGDVVAGGDFDAAGNVRTTAIARWNGSTWSPLGTGTNSEVSALVVLPN